MIDSHCHLNYDYAPKTADDLVREAAEHGVTHLITIGTDAENTLQAKQIADRHENVYFTAGIHPHDSIDEKEGDFEKIRMLAREPKCVAIGEIGIDTHYEHSPLGSQLRNLEQHLALALTRRLPIVIHSRESEDVLLEQLTHYAAKVEGRSPGVIHCFTGTRAFGQACIDLGFYISFSGIVTFKNADAVKECARDFPLERMLVETDSPYLAPVPFRGKKCEPKMVTETAKAIAMLKGLPYSEIIKQTRLNTSKLFRIPI